MPFPPQRISWNLLLPKPRLSKKRVGAKGDRTAFGPYRPYLLSPPVIQGSDTSSDDISSEVHSQPNFQDGSSTNAPCAEDSVAPATLISPVPEQHIPRKTPSGHVGLSDFPEQVRRRSMRRGFQFTIMVVGESGLGKSTLINTLFSISIQQSRQPSNQPDGEHPSTVAIESISADIKECGVHLKLTIVDTPGYGDFVDNDKCWNSILENIESRFEEYHEQETQIDRRAIVDNRVHACLYFIQPTGHSLKQVDIEFMRRLHEKVNLIPVIAKADMMAQDDIANFKARILADISHHKICVFRPPVRENEDAQSILEMKTLSDAIPFAVVGSSHVLQVPNGKLVRGRAYPWGVVEVDNEDHCDFAKLRRMLIGTYMEELREHTNMILYEKWRTEKLLIMGTHYDLSASEHVNQATRYQEERAMHETRLAKIEAEMTAVFQQKVSEKEDKLKQSEKELYARYREMREVLDKQLNEKQRRLHLVQSTISMEQVATDRKLKPFLLI